jgi:hypothetical protein
MTKNKKWLSEHLHNGIISGDPEKYEEENLNLEERLFIRTHIADFHSTNGKRLPEMQKSIDTLKDLLAQSK